MAEALSLVERGWRGARESARQLVRRGDRVRHVIRGTLSRDVRALIEDSPRERVVDAPPWRFRLQAWAQLVGATARGRLRWVLVDNERTQRQVRWWCRAFRIRLVRVQEAGGEYALLAGGRPVAFQEAFADARGDSL